jgi:hypothetical protein
MGWTHKDPRGLRPQAVDAVRIVRSPVEYTGCQGRPYYYLYSWPVNNALLFLGYFFLLI